MSTLKYHHIRFNELSNYGEVSNDRFLEMVKDGFIHYAKENAG